LSKETAPSITSLGIRFKTNITIKCIAVKTKISKLIMELAALKYYLLAKPATTLGFPFGDDINVFKVKNKMFALIGWRNDLMMLNLKCDPDEAAALRDIFPAITAGYHMNKKHWISVYFDGSIPQGEVERMIDNSYMLVVNKMTKKYQQSINFHEGE
jgi:predicted DNA-binding protein (MmcQ/YjbR family)